MNKRPKMKICITCIRSLKDMDYKFDCNKCKSFNKEFYLIIRGYLQAVKEAPRHMRKGLAKELATYIIGDIYNQ